MFPGPRAVVLFAQFVRFNTTLQIFKPVYWESLFSPWCQTALISCCHGNELSWRPEQKFWGAESFISSVRSRDSALMFGNWAKIDPESTKGSWFRQLNMRFCRSHHPDHPPPHPTPGNKPPVLYSSVLWFWLLPLRLNKATRSVLSLQSSSIFTAACSQKSVKLQSSVSPPALKGGNCPSEKLWIHENTRTYKCWPLWLRRWIYVFSLPVSLNDAQNWIHPSQHLLLCFHRTRQSSQGSPLQRGGVHHISVLPVSQWGPRLKHGHRRPEGKRTNVVEGDFSYIPAVMMNITSGFKQGWETLRARLQMCAED